MSEVVQNMFGAIAKRYDLANDVLSFGVHRLWRNSAVNFSAVQKGEKVLDLCTGTGDLAFCLAKRVGAEGSVTALDFVPEMIELAKEKQSSIKDNSDPRRKIIFKQGDALALNLPDNSFDLATVAFGIRNVDSPLECLKEMSRVVVPGGKIMVIEFGQPRLPGFATIYRLYSKYLMPLIGGAVAGNRAAYEYLPRTSSQFPAGREFAALMQQAGLVKIRFKPYLSGVAYTYLAEVPLQESQGNTEKMRMQK